MSNTDFKVTIPEGGSLRYAMSAPNRIVPIVVNPYLYGTLNIRFADSNQPSATNPTPSIKKPFIVLGGYDPLNNYGYPQLLRDLDGQYYNAFNDQLSGSDYDLIFLDYGAGGASILNNEILFRQALQWVNNNKVVDNNGIMQRNVVMGISMGGLIARYGLARMEKAFQGLPYGNGFIGYTNHDTRLLITHDSPHQGANIPAGIQYIGRVALSVQLVRLHVPPITDLATFADSPAAREMLTYYTTLGSFTSNFVTWNQNTFLAQYRNIVTFPPNFPVRYKFIATSQGGECGVGIVVPNASLFDSVGGIGASVGWGTIAADIGYEFYINAASGNNRTLFFKLYKRTTLFSYFGGGIVINRNMVFLDKNNPFPTLALDSQPGGITPTGQYASSLPTGGGTVPVALGYFTFTASIATNIAPGFCFVPRNSALDMINSNYSGALSNGYSVASTLSHARDGFITQERTTAAANSANIAHTEFNSRQTRWIFDVMQDELPTPRLNCAKNCLEPLDVYYQQLIANPNAVISNNGLGVYSVVNQAGLSYTWSIASGTDVFISGATNGSSVTTIRTGVGICTIKVRIRTNCWFKDFIVPIVCAPPVGDYETQPNSQGKIVRCAVNNALQPYPRITYITPITMMVVNGIVVNFPMATPTSTVNIYSPTNPSLILAMVSATGAVLFYEPRAYVVFATNICGAGRNFNFEYVIDPNCKVVGGTPKSTINFVVSPNPSSGNEITIAQEISKVQSTSSETSSSGEEQPQAPTEAKNEEFTLILYNKLQIKVRETTLNTLSKTISTEGLPNDVYFLHIISKDGSKVVKQVMGISKNHQFLKILVTE